jgi:hypothetical protein
MNIAKKVAQTKVVPAPVPPPVQPVAVVDVPFLSFSGSVEPVTQSTLEVEVLLAVEPVVEAVAEEPTPAASEEQCASPPVPASTVSSHTESSSE